MSWDTLWIVLGIVGYVLAMLVGMSAHLKANILLRRVERLEKDAVLTEKETVEWRKEYMGNVDYKRQELWNAFNQLNKSSANKTDLDRLNKYVMEELPEEFRVALHRTQVNANADTEMAVNRLRMEFQGITNENSVVEKPKLPDYLGSDCDFAE